jgi:hypothetical protein
MVFILGRGRADEVDWSNRKEGRSGSKESAPRDWNGPFLRVTAGSVAGSETLAYKIQTPGNFPEDYILQLQHCESLKTTVFNLLSKKAQIRQIKPRIS